MLVEAQQQTELVNQKNLIGDMKVGLLSFVVAVVGISAANASLNSLLGIHIDLKNSQNVDSGNYLRKPLLNDLTDIATRLAAYIEKNRQSIQYNRNILYATSAALLLLTVASIWLTVQLHNLSVLIASQRDSIRYPLPGVSGTTSMTTLPPPPYPNAAATAPLASIPRFSDSGRKSNATAGAA